MRAGLAMLGLVAALLAVPARAQDEAAIRAVISDQLAAFQADDLAAAFGFASPSIRRLFGTPERFGAMVRAGYPMVWRPGAVRFASLARRDGRLVQGVLITDRAGALHVLDYEMVEDESGWRINGVRFRRAGAGA